jgi:predicted nucleic acid-binding protein
MNVLVDTPVWSLARRRNPSNLNPREQKMAQALDQLIQEGRAQLLGIVRQELLSGVREPAHFAKLRDHLRDFDDPVMEIADYEEAARAHNSCRSRGIAGSTIDFLICAVAVRRGWQILTADRDFEHYRSVLRITLHDVP